MLYVCEKNFFHARPYTNVFNYVILSLKCYTLVELIYNICFINYGVYFYFTLYAFLLFYTYAYILEI